MPLVVRLEGTNVDLGKEIIAKSGLNVISADDLDDEVTADLFNEITAGLDKDLWFLEAHLQ